MGDHLKVYMLSFLIGGLFIGIITGSVSTLFFIKNNQPQSIPVISPTIGVSQSCIYNNKTYQHGEGFRDECNSCSCQNGQVTCTTMACGLDTTPVESNRGTTGKTQLSQYPDLPLTTLPVTPISTQYLIEHRSALNGATVLLTGVIIAFAPQEQTCPNSGNELYGGMCGQPYIIVANTADENRDKNYDIVVRVEDSLKASDFPVGQTAQVRVSITASETDLDIQKVNIE